MGSFHHLLTKDYNVILKLFAHSHITVVFLDHEMTITCMHLIVKEDKWYTPPLRDMLIRKTKSLDTSNGSLIISFSALISVVCLQIVSYYRTWINNQLRSLCSALRKYAPVGHFEQFCKFPAHISTAKSEKMTSPKQSLTECFTFRKHQIIV